MLEISAIIITKNEQTNIARCINSLSFVKEIIVVDAKSTDDTVKIAKQLGAKVYVKEWSGFCAQKAFAVEQAKFPWILWIDADEEASVELCEEIKTLNPATAGGFLVSRKVFYLNKWVKHCGWYPGYVLRLFNKNKGHFNNKPVHEGITLDGKTKKLTYPLYHYPYKNIAHHVEKINLYTTLAADNLYKKGKSAFVLKPLFKGFIKFFRMYVLRRGFLDGKNGLVICIMGALTDVLKHIKHWEKQSHPPPN